MEKLSRVKKYEDLRKQIEDHSIGSDVVPEEQLQNYAQRLNDLDPSIFKKVNILDEEVYTPERERKNTEYNSQNENTIADFRNEYLDDFINEVREYNIKKGNRENENTQIDILNQLQASTRPKRSTYVESIQEEESQNSGQMSKEEIVAQVQNFLLEEDDQQTIEPVEVVEPIYTKPVEETVKKEQEIPHLVIEPYTQTQSIPVQKPIPAAQDVEKTQYIDTAEIARQSEKMTNAPRVKEPEYEVPRPFSGRKTRASVVPTKDEQIEIEREKQLQQKLVEETQQLRVQLNEYEEDLNDLSEGVEKTNKMLNVILGCLILALLVIIGIIIYWVVGKAGGIV